MSAELPDATKQTKNRARLLLAIPQCRLAFIINAINCCFYILPVTYARLPDFVLEWVKYHEGAGYLVYLKQCTGLLRINWFTEMRDKN